jgi:hypothetical protein
MVAIFAFFGFFFLAKSMTENERARPELFTIWFILAVVYTGLFFVCKSRGK